MYKILAPHIVSILFISNALSHEYPEPKHLWDTYKKSHIKTPRKVYQELPEQEAESHETEKYISRIEERKQFKEHYQSIREDQEKRKIEGEALLEEALKIEDRCNALNNEILRKTSAIHCCLSLFFKDKQSEELHNKKLEFNEKKKYYNQQALGNFSKDFREFKKQKSKNKTSSSYQVPHISVPKQPLFQYETKIENVHGIPFKK